VKPKGRPPLEPRITLLEAKVKDLMEATLELMEATLDLHARLSALEARGGSMPPLPSYEPLFARWPNGRP
jgi:hypothetical protein